MKIANQRWAAQSAWRRENYGIEKGNYVFRYGCGSVGNFERCLRGALRNDSAEQLAGFWFSCTIADKTFSNFLYNPDGFNVPAANVGVTPVGAGTSSPGILFNGGWQNTGTTNLDATIGFTVTAPASGPITDASDGLRHPARHHV